MQELGAGAYGKVYLGKCREQQVAVKGKFFFFFFFFFF
jgi:hypothetical protein